MGKLTIDKNHIYRWDGIIIPGVTEILSAVGIVDVSAVPTARLEAARHFGIAVHRACELYDRGLLAEDILDVNLRPYLAGWALFRQEYGFVPDNNGIEKSLFSSRYRFAGTIDRFGKCRIDNTLIIVDIKSGVEVPSVPVQMAAYEILVRETSGISPLKTRRLGIYLDKNGTYKIRDYKDKLDANIFLSTLSIYNWRKKWIPK